MEVGRGRMNLLFLLLAWLTVTGSTAGPSSNHLGPGAYGSSHFGNGAGNDIPPGPEPQHDGFKNEQSDNVPFEHRVYTDESYINQFTRSQPQELQEPSSSALGYC